MTITLRAAILALQFFVQRTYSLSQFSCSFYGHNQATFKLVISPLSPPQFPCPRASLQAAMLEKKNRHTLQGCSSQKKDKVSLPLNHPPPNSLKHLAVIRMIIKSISRAALKYYQQVWEHGWDDSGA